MYCMLHGRCIRRCTKLSDALLLAVRAVKDAAARRVVATKKTAELEDAVDDTIFRRSDFTVIHGGFIKKYQHHWLHHSHLIHLILHHD